MPSKLYSVTRQGMETQTIEVEVDVTSGLHSFSIVGLPDKAVEESKERISSALKNKGFKAPRHFSRRVIINLAPADIKKEGGIYDLPMALGFLLDSDQVKIKGQNLEKTLIVGELGLDGKIRPIKGVILYTIHAKEVGFTNIIVPAENKKEASLIRGVEVIAANDIKELIAHIEGRKPIKPAQPKKLKSARNAGELFEHDFAYIKGQESAKKAMEVAVAGGHNIMFQGPPGTGKTMLARSASTIMPPMSYKEALEVTKIESVCRRLPSNNPLVQKRPFRAPHHTSSEAAVIGGGAKLQPGEITRAHRGILFIDEFPELHRNVLESLRQPLEEGSIMIARARGVVEYPAQFMLIAAANPCPCGYLGDKSRACSCTTGSITRYQRKLSGPIADRIDLHVQVPRQKFKKISSKGTEEPSKEVAKRVAIARKVQLERFKNSSINLNSEMKIKHIKKYCHLPDKLNKMLGQAVEKYRLSARGYHSSLKVARTVADLSQDTDISWRHLALALQYAKREKTEI
ncbi:MAG: YifB family Mg chelatase-like AAA ATPase [Candidatus Spechtbacterales bacterium]|nr:YifB family Mg chelatase-like AAA ATPase [Candidatus Spechtbacterales bacterium]